MTARRVEENGQRVPVSVTIVPGDRLDALAINTPLDLNKVAGLGGAPIGSLTSVNFTIRGQGAAFGGQQGVIPYFAEVPFFPLTYFDLRNVQVIKGPQGTLFGQTSTGGVVLFEPRRPGDRLEGAIQVQAGLREYLQVDGTLNLPLASDRLAARLAFRVRERNGWGRAVYSDGRPSTDLNNLSDRSMRVSLLWKPTDRVSNLLLYAHDLIRNHGNLSPLYYADVRFMNPAVRNLVPASVPSIAAAWQYWAGYAPPPGKTFGALLLDAFDRQRRAGARTMFTDYGQQNRTANEGWIDQATWEVPGLFQIKNVFGLRYSTARGATYDQDATDLPLLDFQCRFAVGATSSRDRCAEVGGWPDRSLTDELRLQGQMLGGRLNYQVGAFYLRTGTRRFREDTRPFVVFGSLSGDPASSTFCASVSVPVPCASMSRTQTRSYAAFGQASFAVTPQLNLTAGYRETWDRTQTETTGKPSYRVPFAGQLVAVPVYGEKPFAGATIVKTVVELPANGSYNLSADWRPTDRVLLYVAHRSGYKTGGINAVANPGTPQRTYGPERARDVEVGIKSDWNLGPVRGRLNADLFQTWYSDIQEGQIIPGTAQTVTTNLAAARIRGIEIEGDVEPTAWIRVEGNLALTDARYTDWLERSSCAAQYWRPQCAGLPGATTVTIDHAHGDLEIAGQSLTFRPDRFANTSKWQWSIRPSFRLQGWLHQNVTLSANLYHRGPYVDATAVANTSKLAGVDANPQATVFGGVEANPYDAPGYGLLDVRLDWKGIGGTRVSLAAGVTNVTNKIYRVSSASAFEIIGGVYSLVGEPRMAFLEASYSF